MAPATQDVKTPAPTALRLSMPAPGHVDAEALVANHPSAFYVASYPRSGNTWVVNCLVRLFGGIRAEARSQFTPYPHLYGDPRCDDFHLRSEKPIGPNQPLIIKSHDPFSVFATTYPQKPCVYVMRDGRDSLLSFYFFMEAFGDRTKTVAERLDSHNVISIHTKQRVVFDKVKFMKFLEQQAPKWVEHVLGWTAPGAACVVRYEEMSRDLRGTLERIQSYVGLPSSVDLCEVEKEFGEGFKSHLKGDNAQFYRKGIVGDWRNYFDGDAVALFERLAGQANIYISDIARAWPAHPLRRPGCV